MINLKKTMVKAIEFYQAMPLHTHSLCRFTPTCSQYMKEAILRFGPKTGLKYGLKRICRCHPFGKYGYDPVPETMENK